MSKLTRTLAFSLPALGLLATACEPIEPPREHFLLADGAYRMSVHEVATMGCPGEIAFDDDIFDEVFFAQLRTNRNDRGYTLSLEGIELKGSRSNNKLSLSWNEGDAPTPEFDDDVDVDEDNDADAPRMMTTMPGDGARPIRDFPDIGALLSISAQSRLSGSLFIEEDIGDSFCTIELDVSLVHIDGAIETDPQRPDVHSVDVEYED